MLKYFLLKSLFYCFLTLMGSSTFSQTHNYKVLEIQYSSEDGKGGMKTDSSSKSNSLIALKKGVMFIDDSQYKFIKFVMRGGPTVIYRGRDQEEKDCDIIIVSVKKKKIKRTYISVSYKNRMLTYECEEISV